MNLHDLFNEVKGIPQRPWEVTPIEGGGMGSSIGFQSQGYGSAPRFTVPIIPNNVPGGANMPMAGRNLARDMATGRNVGGNAIPSLGQSGKVVTNKTADNVLTKLGGKNVEITPGPKVTPGSSSANMPLDVEVPAYIRQGKSDPVTMPVPGTKPTIKVKPGETMDQAIQRTKSEQEFGKFLQGQSGQTFGTPGAGRGGQGGPTASQATSGADQVPTIRLPGGKLVVDTNRIGPNGQIIPPAASSDHVGGKEAYDAALKTRKDQWNKMKTGKEKEGEQRRSAWKNPETDVDLEEQSIAPATNAPTLRSAQGQAAGTAPRGLTPQQQTAFAPHLKTDAATGSQYYDTPDTDPKEVGAMMGTKITTPAAQALVKSPQGQAGVIKHLTAVTDPANAVKPGTTTVTPMSATDAAASVPDSQPTQQPASEDVHRLRKLSGIANKDIEETRKKREQPEAKYDDQYDAMVARVQKLAGIGPMKTVWDPNKRVYRNVPTAQQPQKK